MLFEAKMKEILHYAISMHSIRCFEYNMAIYELIKIFSFIN